MNKDPFSKLHSSLSLEDLLAQPNTRNSQNWLLTYLDVFVLIIMLVITMISLTDINTQQQQAVANQPKTPPIIAKCPPVKIIESLPPQQIALTEHNVEIKPDKSDILTDPKKSINDVIAPVNPPKFEINTQSTPSTLKPTTVDSPANEFKLQQQLTKTIDQFGLNNSINVKVTHGYAELEIQDNVLFKSSESKLTSSGEALIKRLTPLLKQAVGLILIEGHTDNIPIKTSQFPSNWELGSSRATSVLHFLISQNLDSNHLRAITYADTMPIADNSTAEGREKNRRVKIIIKFPES